MKSSQTVLVILSAAFAFGNVGCMRGVTYKIAMPQSMTLGTVKAEEATLASAQTTGTPRTVAAAAR